MSTAAASAIIALAGLAHRQGAAFIIFAVQSEDRGLGPFLSIHGKESEAARAAGHFVHDNIDLVDRAMLANQVAKVVFGDVKGKIPDV